MTKTYDVRNGHEVWKAEDNGDAELIAECNGTMLARKVRDALNRPRFTFQIWNAGNDTNGNPRRVTMVYSAATIVAALDNGYGGDHIPRGGAQLPSVNCTVKDYREACQGEEDRRVARVYLHRQAFAGYLGQFPTSIDAIGRDMDRAGEAACQSRRKAFRAYLKECGASKAQITSYSGVRSAIWDMESWLDNGVEPYIGLDGKTVSL